MSLWGRHPASHPALGTPDIRAAPSHAGLPCPASAAEAPPGSLPRGWAAPVGPPSCPRCLPAAHLPNAAPAKASHLDISSRGGGAEAPSGMCRKAGAGTECSGDLTAAPPGKPAAVCRWLKGDWTNLRRRRRRDLSLAASRGEAPMLRGNLSSGASGSGSACVCVSFMPCWGHQAGQWEKLDAGLGVVVLFCTWAVLAGGLFRRPLAPERNWEPSRTAQRALPQSGESLAVGTKGCLALQQGL